MVPTLLEDYSKGFDMVVGARTGQYYEESFFKSLLRTNYVLLLNLVPNEKFRI